MSRSPRLLRTQAGSLLIVTLWVVTILVVLVVAIARTLSLEVRLTKYRLAREQARALARSGVYLAMERLRRDVADDEHYDWLGDDWALEQVPISSADPEGRVEIEIVDEERKLNVNSSTTETAQQLASVIGAGDFVNALIDYRDADSNGEWEALSEGPAYYPKNADLVAPEELREIPGQTTETLEAAHQSTSPYVTGSKVNINTAPLEVLEVVLVSAQLTQEQRTHALGLANTIIDLREHERYFTTLEPVPAPFDSSAEFGNALRLLQVHSDTFRISATGRLTNPKVRHRINAVVRRGGQDVRIIAWREG